MDEPNPYKSPTEEVATLWGEKQENSGKSRWLLVLCLLAILLTFLSVLASPEGPLWGFNLLVLAPLWSAAAALTIKGKIKLALAIGVILLLATNLSMMQTAILAAREARGPGMITRYTMRYTLEQIQGYMKVHGQVPPNLHALPLEEGSSHKPIDEWGHDLQYSVDRDGVITLASFGADCQPGGDGQDADIIMHYRTRKADGTLNVDGDFLDE